MDSSWKDADEDPLEETEGIRGHLSRAELLPDLWGFGVGLWRLWPPWRGGEGDGETISREETVGWCEAPGLQEGPSEWGAPQGPVVLAISCG